MLSERNPVERRASFYGNWQLEIQQKHLFLHQGSTTAVGCEIESIALVLTFSSGWGGFPV